MNEKLLQRSSSIDGKMSSCVCMIRMFNNFRILCKCPLTLGFCHTHTHTRMHYYRTTKIFAQHNLCVQFISSACTQYMWLCVHALKNQFVPANYRHKFASLFICYMPHTKRPQFIKISPRTRMNANLSCFFLTVGSLGNCSRHCKANCYFLFAMVRVIYTR